VQVNSTIPLVEGEELLWHRGSTKGFLHKEVVMEEGVTNKRLVKYDVENKRIIAQLGSLVRTDTNIRNSSHSVRKS